MSSSTRSATRKRGAPASQSSNGTTGSVNKKRRMVATAGKAVNNKVQQPTDDTKFWKKPGMKTFLSWLLNPSNQQRLKKAGTTSGVMKKDLYREIVDLVNAEATNQTHEEWQPWVERHVKYNITASEQKYRKAKKMWTETGAGDDDKSLLRKRVLKICPLFDKFDRVYSSNFRVNPPPMVQTTTIPGEPTELLDDSDEGDESGEGEGDGSEEGDECVEDEEGDESDEGGEDMVGLEDHRHLQVEGFDMSQLFADDDDETVNNTHASNSTSFVHKTEPSISSSTKNQQSKKPASKGKSKDAHYPQHEAMFQKLSQLSSMNAAPSGGLMENMRRDIAERERDCLKRELDWVNHGLERMAELNRKLEERREEHERQLQQAKAAFEKEKAEWTLFKNEEMAKLNRLKGTLDRQESHSQSPSVIVMNIVKNSPFPPPSASL